MDDVARIAAGLSEAQRRVLGNIPGHFGRGNGRVGRILIRKGLAVESDRYAYYYSLTPLGLAVRAHLQAETQVVTEQASDALTDAFNHFHAMVCGHPLKGYPTGYVFSEETRDAARVLMEAVAATKA